MLGQAGIHANHRPVGGIEQTSRIEGLLHKGEDRGGKVLIGSGETRYLEIEVGQLSQRGHGRAVVLGEALRSHVAQVVQDHGGFRDLGECLKRDGQVLHPVAGLEGLACAGQHTKAGDEVGVQGTIFGLRADMQRFANTGGKDRQPHPGLHASAHHGGQDLGILTHALPGKTILQQRIYTVDLHIDAAEKIYPANSGIGHLEFLKGVGVGDGAVGSFKPGKLLGVEIPYVKVRVNELKSHGYFASKPIFEPLRPYQAT